MTMARRMFLCGGGVAALAVLDPSRAWARRERILEEDRVDAPPPAPAGTFPDLTRAVERLRVGQASRHGALLVFWLHPTHAAPYLDVATLDEGRAGGTLVITERDSASVPELVVDNRGKSHVLLLAGEILVGGKQNRVLREDILLPPRSGPRAIGVYCVERGRWNEGRRDFESKSSFAQPGLRKEVYSKADQGRVWAEVDRAARAAAAPSPTGSYQQVYEQPQVKEQLVQAEKGIDIAAGAGAVGAAAFIGPRLGGIDLFRDPGLFARQWRKLLRAHAVEAAGQPADPSVAEGKLRVELHALLGSVARVDGTVRGNAGVGQIFEFRLDPYRGAALAHDGGIVHAALL